MCARRRGFEEATVRLISPPPTPAELASASIVWHLLRIARHVETQLEFEVHRPKGWSWSGFRIMANLYVEGPLEPSQLANILEVSRPTISSGIAQLERDGYVLRAAHPDSRTRILVDLTEEGRRAVEHAVEPHHRREVSLVASLSDEERHNLAALLQKLYLGLQDSD